MRKAPRRSIMVPTRSVKVAAAAAFAAVLVSASLHAEQASQGSPVPGGVPGGVLGAIAEAPPPPPPPPAPAVRIGGDIKPPVKIKHVNPEYPPIAQSARVQGVVIVEATIGPDGLVTNTRILRSIPLLDLAALDAVRQWQFQPTLVQGVPVPVIMTVTVQFTLTDDEAVPRDCSLEATLRSSASSTAVATALTFDNQSGALRRLYQLDAEGHRVLDSTLDAGLKLERATSVGHAWLAATDDDRCMAIYVATAGARTATLRPPTPPTPQSRLDEALRNLERFTEDQQAQNAPQADIRFDTKGVDFGPWVRAFTVQVKRQWFVPITVLRTSAETAVIRFRVLRNGEVTEVELVRPAPTDALNAAALEALKRSSPVEALPAAYPDASVQITMTLNYAAPTSGK